MFPTMMPAAGDIRSPSATGMLDGDKREPQSSRLDCPAALPVAEDLEYRLQFESLIMGISTHFINLPTNQIDRGINEALARIGEFVGVDRSYVFLLSHDGETISYTHEWCACGVESQVSLLARLPVAALPWWIARLRRFEAIQIADPAELPQEARAERELLKAVPNQSLLLVPMAADRNLVGILGVDSLRARRVWSEESIALLRIVSEIFVSALERKRTEQRLAHLAAIVESTEDAIIGLSLDGLITSWNPGAERLYGYSVEEVIGRRPSFLLPPGHEQAFEERMGKIRRGEHVPPYEMVRLGKGGVPIDVSLRMSPIFDVDGTIVAGAVIVRDIRELKRAAELRQAKETAEAANAAKSQFLSRMSHELRTPLNAILGFAQLLEMEPLPEHQRESLGYILRAGSHLLALINEVLDVSWVETGRLALQLAPLEVGLLLHESVELIGPLAAKRNLTVKLRLPAAPEVRVLADEQRLKQVLLNLLSNAVKYNRDGGMIQVRCELRSATTLQPEVRPLLRIAVRDTGLGIPADKLDRLFMPFERLGAEHSRIEGTGLGLVLTKLLVEAMDGVIEVHSSPGVGSCFWIDLPLAGAKPLAGPAPSLTSRLLAAGRDLGTGDLSRYSPDVSTIMYVEDNPANLRLMGHILDQRPNTIMLPAREKSALDLAREYRPELILLDLPTSPDVAETLLRQLHSDPRTTDIPVVIVNAIIPPERIAALQAAGAHDCLAPPLDADRMLTVINSALDRPA